MKSKATIFWGLSLLVGSVVVLFTVVPGFIDSYMNKTEQLPSTKARTNRSEIHDRLFVSDLHADTLLWSRNILKKSARGHVDVPRLQAGNIALQAFSVVTKAPVLIKAENAPSQFDGVTLSSLLNLWSPASWANYHERTLYQAEQLASWSAESNGALRIIRTANELREFRDERTDNSREVGAWLTVEGLHFFDGDFAKLDELFSAGYRMMGAVHFFDNQIGGSLSGLEKKGLTPLGIEWVNYMNRKKIIIDLAHLSETAMNEVLDLSQRPAIVSHSGVYKICQKPRNLSDQQIQKIAKKGGIIGIGLWSGFTCDSSIESVVKSIGHVCKLVGCQHVALGSDWDGTITATVSSENIGLLTEKLLTAGFTPEQIALIMGENIYNFLIQNLP